MTGSEDVAVVSDLRERLLDAAWHLMTLPGPAEAVTVSRVCAAVGCTPRMLFRKIESLEELIRRTSARAFAQWADEIENAIGTTAGPLERVRRRGEEYMRWGLEHPRAYLTLFGERAGPTGTSDAYRALMADLATAHGLAADDPDVSVLALAHWAGVHGLTSLAIANPSLTAEARMAAYHRLRHALNAPG